MMNTSIDRIVLQMALVGYEAEAQKVRERIAAIERELGGRTPKAAVSSDGAPRKRKPLSAASLKHIRDAQKKRWAAFHAKEEPKVAEPKRKMSAATKKKLAANLAKARAAKAAKAAA
jgi:hypothetical protein